MTRLIFLFLAFCMINSGAFAQWIHRTDVGSPGQRTAFAMAYDKDRGVTVFFGGEFGPGGGETYYNDTWEYDGSQWRQITVSGPRPDPRSGHSMCYDTVHHNVILVGGVNGNGYPGDMWSYVSTGPGQGAWTYRGGMQADNEESLAGSALVFDESRGVAVRMMGEGVLTPAFGQTDAVLGKSRTIAYYNNLGASSQFPSWKKLALYIYAAKVTARASAAYDEQTHKILLYGGATNNPIREYLDSFLHEIDLGDRRTFVNPTTGTFYSYDQNPSIAQACSNDGITAGTQQTAMVYDPVRDRLLVFGGQNDPDFPAQSLSAATREFVRNPNPPYPWVGPNFLSTTSFPPGRAGHAMVYDTRRHVIVLYGGASGNTRYDDTWELPSAPTSGPVWVDFAYIGANFGSSDFPFANLAEAVQVASSVGRDLLLKGPRTTSQRLTISKAVTLRAVGGQVTIGQP